MTEPRVTAIVLAYGAEPWLSRSVEALLASQRAKVDVIVVDNGCTDGEIAKLAGTPGVTILTPQENLGFSGGCNFGADAATGDFIALVNNDAVVEPSTIASLASVAAQPGVGIAGASVRLSEDPNLINSAGNPMHILGISWAGRMGQPEHLTSPEEVTIASGACLLTTRAHWTKLGGFDPLYFMYHEDSELSIRTWRQGLSVIYVPQAIAVHRYEFSRNSSKFYLLERNRLMLLSTVWSGRSLTVLAPALLGLEAAMVLLAAKQGWLREKLRGWGWLWRHRSHIRTRRRLLKAERTISDRAFMSRMTPRLDISADIAPAALIKLLNPVVATYWSLAHHALSTKTPHPPRTSASPEPPSNTQSRHRTDAPHVADASHSPHPLGNAQAPHREDAPLATESSRSAAKPSAANTLASAEAASPPESPSNAQPSHRTDAPHVADAAHNAEAPR